MLVSLDETALKEALNRVSQFKGKTKIKSLIQDRLDKSLKLYIDELNDECHLIKKLKPKKIGKTLTKIK